ncbi:MAG: signal recognition particle-docking protein FtsY [Candidatus Nanopelagicaceae bacterium]|nr:signal recognition particle-docking protein FtsY [Candidatus Nanopelagicaceae bacterium]
MSLFKKFVDKFTNKSETAAPIQEIEIKELPKDDIWSKPISLEIKDSDWDELASDLIQSDLGRELSSELIEAGKRSKEKPLQAIKLKLEEALSKKSRETKAGVILVVGVNGAGKTTSVAKLAKQLPGKTVLAAADTFRAAAVEQLSTWGQRIGVEVISGAANSDPAAVAFDASKKFMDSGADNLIVDTAGRLHNKADLMAELGKVRRVIEKSAPVSEVLLVIDATTGQNGLAQAQVFTEAVEVTGIILTKLDGSARGGIALAIEHKFNIPIKWVGSGEGVDDFAPFDAQSYLSGLLG